MQLSCLCVCVCVCACVCAGCQTVAIVVECNLVVVDQHSIYTQVGMPSARPKVLNCLGKCLVTVSWKQLT